MGTKEIDELMGRIFGEDVESLKDELLARIFKEEQERLQDEYNSAKSEYFPRRANRRGYIATGATFQIVVLHDNDDFVVGVSTQVWHGNGGLDCYPLNQVIDFQEPCVASIARIVDNINKYQQLANLSPNNIVGLDRSKQLLQDLCEEILREDMHDIVVNTAEKQLCVDVHEAVRERFSEQPCCGENEACSSDTCSGFVAQADGCNNKATRDALDEWENIHKAQVECWKSYHRSCKWC